MFVGETTIYEAVDPVLHAYVPPPVAVIVVVCPAQMVVGLPLTVAGGLAHTMFVQFGVFIGTMLLTVGVKEEAVAVVYSKLAGVDNVGA